MKFVIASNLDGTLVAGRWLQFLTREELPPCVRVKAFLRYPVDIFELGSFSIQADQVAFVGVLDIDIEHPDKLPVAFVERDGDE